MTCPVTVTITVFKTADDRMTASLECAGATHRVLMAAAIVALNGMARLQSCDCADRDRAVAEALKSLTPIATARFLANAGGRPC